MNKTTDTAAPKPLYADLLGDALRVHHAARSDAHSVEVRHVVALEQIADELTAIRVHLIGAATSQQG